MRIVFLDRASLRAKIRTPAFPHEWTDFDNTPSDAIVPRLLHADIAITNKVPLRDTTIAQLPHLKLIAVAATGIDIIDLDACRRRNITVTNIRNYASHSVPEHTIALMLALRRNLFNLRNAVNAGAWQHADQFCLLDYPIHDLSGATLGLVGYGTLARRVEGLAKAFGMQVILAERRNASSVRPGRTRFEDVLSSSDVISLHSPLTPVTSGMIGEAELRMMKPSALLINTARGGLIDEAALAVALQKGVIGGAGIDVLSSEPPRNGTPLLNLQLPNLIVTPHVAWASNEAMQTLADILVDNLESFVAGQPQNIVA